MGWDPGSGNATDPGALMIEITVQRPFGSIDLPLELDLAGLLQAAGLQGEGVAGALNGLTSLFNLSTDGHLHIGPFAVSGSTRIAEKTLADFNYHCSRGSTLAHRVSPGDPAVEQSGSNVLRLNMGRFATARGLDDPDDRIHGGPGVDHLLGGDDDDLLVAGSGIGDLSEGGPGDDTLEAWPDRVILSNGPNDATLDFNVVATGFEDMQAYAVGGGSDTAILHGSSGNDTKDDASHAFGDELHLYGWDV